MGDLFLIRFGGEGDGPSPRERELERLRARYARHLVDALAMDETMAALVIATLFAPRGRDGKPCFCGCHPGLSAQHDDGFECPCTWDQARREAVRGHLFADLQTPEQQEWRKRLRDEEAAAEAWIARQEGVSAELVSRFAPEQWRGTIDGHTFYFRERHGDWSIELDLQPTGSFAERIVGTDESGEFITEDVPVTAGEVIAEGVDSDLGTGLIAHLSFILRTVRDHIFLKECDHAGALFFCPMCGKRMDGPQ
ncbi:MAG TPA: hypothetical protein VNF07_01810 [Acidimicrobiales bacterium]|nr:hypothetical protein [Acidimicrobiales bacterium]